MADESLHSLKRLRIAADITRTLAAQMAELRELREAVQLAEAATARRGLNQRYDETVPYRAEANDKENKALPGRLFMQSQWR